MHLCAQLFLLWFYSGSKILLFSITIISFIVGTDGTRPPRTFDAAAPPDRPSGGANDRADRYRNSDVTPTSDASWPPAYANRTDKSSGVLGWLNVKSETLLYVIGGVLGALFLLMVIFMVICTMKQRKQKKLVNGKLVFFSYWKFCKKFLILAAQGKYRDTSKKIYREQALCNDRSVMKDMVRQNGFLN